MAAEGSGSLALSLLALAVRCSHIHTLTHPHSHTHTHVGCVLVGLIRACRRYGEGGATLPRARRCKGDAATQQCV